uniref:Uncharacterized protein n=1 Tax=Anopheles albimanus TaxID=7167 RepID=A0A182FQJ8_ANOAL
MSTNDGDVHLLRVDTGRLTDERVSTDDIERRDTEYATRVQHSSLLQRIAGNRHGRVDRVRDDADEGFRARLGTTRSQIPHDRGVRVEQIVTGHARLAGYTSRNDNDIGALQGLLQILGTIVTGHLRLGLDVRQIRRDAGRVHDVVQRQFRNQRAVLEQQRQRLTDATGSTANCHLHIVLARGGEVFGALRGGGFYCANKHPDDFRGCEAYDRLLGLK